MRPPDVPSVRVLGVRVDSGDYRGVTERIADLARTNTPSYVCAANVHMIMEACDDPAFRPVLERAEIVTSDGMPLVWVLRASGASSAQRVYGPDLMLSVCAEAERTGLKVGLYGSSPAVLARLEAELRRRFPRLAVPYVFSPPFRAMTEEEDRKVVEEIQASGVDILFVGLGCPKQEKWMAEHRDRLRLVQIGVGAAFDFHAGSVRQAPKWMQVGGLEWLFRLAVEPRRLWRRYAYHNPRFIFLAALQLLGLGRRTDGGGSAGETSA